MEIRARYVLIGAFVLAVIAAGLGFVYWLNNTGGFGERTHYEIRFENTVSGLLLGSAVQFNGIRVGEVVDLKLNSEDPRQVIAIIAVASDTPVRADTRVDLEFGGLTGVPEIVLIGGDPAAPPPQAADGGLPVLVAEEGTGADWTQAAREAFQRIDTILGGNSDALGQAIGNINTFAAALARNSEKVDKILNRLERMAAGAAAGPPTLYDLTAPRGFPAGLTVPKKQLVVTAPTSVVALDTQGFLVGTDASQTIAFPESKWTDSLPNLVGAKLTQTFENAGYFRTGGDSQGLTADRQLLTDIRTFRITTGDRPRADIDLTAKIVGSDGQVIEARAFHADAPVKKLEAPAAAVALDEAFSKLRGISSFGRSSSVMWGRHNSEAEIHRCLVPLVVLSAIDVAVILDAPRAVGGVDPAEEARLSLDG